MGSSSEDERPILTHLAYCLKLAGFGTPACTAFKIMKKKCQLKYEWN